MVRILGLGGALRDGSTSLAGLRVALDAAAAAGAETRQLALHELPLPLYRPDFAAPADYGPEAAARVERLIEAARWADGFLWSSPAYHGALSGALKNALDFLQFLARDEPSFLYGKVVGAIGAGGGTIGAVNVVNQLAQIAQALRAQVVPLLVPITFSVRAFDAGRVTDAQVGRRLQSLGAEVVALAAAGEARRAALPAR